MRKQLRGYILSALITLFLLPAGTLAAQQSAPTRTMRIQRLQAEMRIDGHLDEPVWSQIEPEAGFLQTVPDEGQPVSERTEVRVFYDDNNLYLGFWCYDREPHRIIANYDTHDGRTLSDSVTIFLDPYGDRRTGYIFSVNSRGIQYDALASETDRRDSRWDGIWHGGAQLHDWGWSAEVAIPFKSIRFAPNQTWGINLEREIPRKNEEANWQFVARFDGDMRPSKAGSLEGIGDVERGRNLEIVPYFSGRSRHGAALQRDNGQQFQGGVDIRWGVLPNATVNVAVNPDFADTEADEQNISVSRFELFFPEKRAFFNEGANFFTTPMNLFFTRRVGQRLPDGQPQSILIGAKLTGKVGPWSMGLLEARTQQERFIDPSSGAMQIAPAANFFTLRLRRDVWGSSTLGFLTVNRDQQPGDLGSTQRVHAVDLNIVSGEHIRWSSQVAYNQNETTPNGGIHRVGARTNFSYETNDWDIRGRYKYLGRGFDVGAIGFEPEVDRHSAAASVGWKPFIDRNGIRQVFFEVNQDISFDTFGLKQDSGSDADLRVEFTNYWSLRGRYSYDVVRFNEFTPGFGRLPTTRTYVIPKVRFFVISNRRSRINFEYQFRWEKFAQFAENYYGRGYSHELSMFARVFNRTRVTFTGAYIREFQLDGTPFQIRRQFITRVAHQFTRRLRTRILAQASSNRHGHNYNINSLLAYDFTARSAFFVGYNFQRQSPGRPGDLGHEVFFKFSYLFQF